MNSLNDYFDKIYAIHVWGYEDRLLCINNIKTTLNCDIEIFNAYTPVNCGLPRTLVKNPAEYACGISHMKLWEKILKDRPERPLILEDDVIVNKDIDVFKLLSDNYINLLDPIVDIAYLGLNYTHKSNYQYIGQHLIKIKASLASHAYSPSMDFLSGINFNKLHNYFNNCCLAFDTLLSENFINLNILGLKPPILYQKPGYSIILNRNVDYTHMLK